MSEENNEQKGPVETGENEKKQGVRWLWVLRDVGIIWGLTLFIGFVVGFTMGLVGTRPSAAYLGFANLVFVVIGFVIAGCLTPSYRLRHLSIVALLVWLTSLLNVALGLVTLAQWIAAAVFIAIMMALGYGISLIIRPEEKV